MSIGKHKKIRQRTYSIVFSEYAIFVQSVLQAMDE